MAIIPILSILVVGAWILGATALDDFGLALFIGLTTGAYSSIFIASPLLAYMKEREPRYITIRQRLEARGERGTALTPAMAAAMAGAAGGSGRASGKARNQTTGVIRPGAASNARRSGSATRTCTRWRKPAVSTRSMSNLASRLPAARRTPARR